MGSQALKKSIHSSFNIPEARLILQWFMLPASNGLIGKDAIKKCVAWFVGKILVANI